MADTGLKFMLMAHKEFFLNYKRSHENLELISIEDLTLVLRYDSNVIKCLLIQGG